ncbi:daptide-type RiPP [Saccharibacillus brassicae]|nr:daptide-type RiPP [Saccharibacillus brassicae]
MNEQQAVDLELLENVEAPGNAQDFITGVATGVGVVAAGAALVAFT